MKKYIVMIVAALSSILNAQSYTVENLSGNVRVLKGTSEVYVKAAKGDKLAPSDFIETGDKSSVAIRMETGSFPLKENSALSLNYLKSFSKSDLILILASEEIKSAPEKKKMQKSNGATAVYGADDSAKKAAGPSNNDMGLKRLNGAKQLADNGYKESSILAAKEAYKKYPSTMSIASYRIFFAEKLIELGLYEEAYSEYAAISALKLTSKEKESVNIRIDEIKNIMRAN